MWESEILCLCVIEHVVEGNMLTVCSIYVLVHETGVGGDVLNPLKDGRYPTWLNNVLVGDHWIYILKARSDF